MEMLSRKWIKRYMGIAQEISTWSKDPSTKVGAVVVCKSSGQILSQGYNGFPRGVVDAPEKLSDREEKLKWVVHAEMNCIYNASLAGVSLKGATLFVHGLPVCPECAKGVVQTGIDCVYMRVDTKNADVWMKKFAEVSSVMFDEVDIRYNYIV